MYVLINGHDVFVFLVSFFVLFDLTITFILFSDVLYCSWFCLITCTALIGLEGDIMDGRMDVWMYGCMDVWMYGCMVLQNVMRGPDRTGTATVWGIVC